MSFLMWPFCVRSSLLAQTTPNLSGALARERGSTYGTSASRLGPRPTSDQVEGVGAFHSPLVAWAADRLKPAIDPAQACDRSREPCRRR